MAPYRRKKPAPTDYTTDEEDMITYDVEEDELEQHPDPVQKDGSITRVATFMDNVSEHVDITELEVKLKKIDQLQRKIEELKELLFGLETAKPTEEAEFEDDLYKCETRLDDLETKTNLLMNRSVENKSCIVCKDKTLHPIFRCKRFLELNPEKRLDLVRLHKLCELCLRKNHKRMQCTSTETEFGWIAGGRLQGTNTNNFSCYFLKDNDSVDDTLKLFFELESLGIKDDPCYRKDDQAMNIFKETVQYNNNRVIFGVNSSPFLLAATIKYHIEKYNEIHPITVQHLDSFMYVDDWITGQDTREEALFMSRHAKNIMKEAGMEMRKWISNDTVLMAQWAAEGFDTHPMDASIRLGTNKTKVLGMAWQTLDDCLTLDTKAAYVKVRKQNEVLVNLITSKTRVAPLKAVTLPRLELLGALVAARLSSRVQEIVRKKKECKVFHWTDSKIVLF
ncbi:integrase catalytic domain-containing protein [Trichonephila clavipes]|nr:integrase catalytic domain-containing protein [Trichonephila clavipes]